MIFNATRAALALAVISALAVTAVAGQATAQQRTVTGERYIPTIWIDLDRCEH